MTISTGISFSLSYGRQRSFQRQDPLYDALDLRPSLDKSREEWETPFVKDSIGNRGNRDRSVHECSVCMWVLGTEGRIHDDCVVGANAKEETWIFEIALNEAWRNTLLRGISRCDSDCT